MNRFLKQLGAVLAAWSICAGSAHAVATWQRWEKSFTSTGSYSNAFMDVTLSVTYDGPGGRSFSTLGFWDGGSTFKIRASFPVAGTWTYQTACTNTSDGGLHNQSGSITVTAYSGSNPLYAHGFLEVDGDNTSLAHADGTPFRWIGDTFWSSTVTLTENSFKNWVDDREGKNFNTLSINIARKALTDADGRGPWDTDAWDVDFMHKLDREFDYANDHGMYLFVNALIDLKWDRGLSDTEYKRMCKMLAARYYAHHIGWSSSMDDPYASEQDVALEQMDQVTDRHIMTQHVGTIQDAPNSYWGKSYYDYGMIQSGHANHTQSTACANAINWSKQYYDKTPGKPVVNGEAMYDGSTNATPEITVQLGYLTLLSGGCGYTYGVDKNWSATDAELSGMLSRQGSTYMKHLQGIMAAVNDGRCLVPEPGWIENQKSSSTDKFAAARTQDNSKLAAFLPDGGRIDLDLSGFNGTVTVGWHNALTGASSSGSSVTGSAVRSFTSPYGTSMSVLILEKSGGSGDTSAPQAPGQVSPADGAQLMDNPTFKWNAVSDQSGIDRYEIQIDNNVIHDAGTETTFTRSVALSVNPHTWRVRAVDGAGNTSNWSTTWDLTVIEPVAGIAGGLSVNDGTNAADWSIRSNLQSGDVQYGDRDYTFTSVPAALAGSTWIRTANDSKSYTGTVATFTVNDDADVYVAHNDMISAKPAWLGDWTDSGLDMVNDEADPVTFSLYKKTFTSGATVTLGENGGTGEGMYTVVVTAAVTSAVRPVSAGAAVRGMHEDAWFDMQGQRLVRPGTRGVYCRVVGGVAEMLFVGE